MTIILNGRYVLVGEQGGLFPNQAGRISYGDIAEWAGYGPDRIVTVTYSTIKQRQGSLTPGQSTQIEGGMIFSVANTSKA